MSTIGLILAAFALIAAFGMPALVWRSLARANKSLDSFGSLEGMHFDDLSTHAQGSGGLAQPGQAR